MTQPKELLRIAVLIDKVFLRSENRLIGQEPIEDINRSSAKVTLYL
jgi:hypothetical protein